MTDLQMAIPHLSTNRRRTLVLALLWAGLAGAAMAQSDWPPPTPEPGFAARAQVAGEDLVLNGTGVRAVAWFKGYAAGLYLTRRGGTAVQVLATPGAKRLQLRMLRDVPAVEFVKALKKGVARNTPAAELAALQGGLQQLADAVAAVGEVRNGDVVDLDFDPARGLLFSVNGKRRDAPIPDPRVYAALLRSFIGDRPYDKRLRAGLLGQPADTLAPPN